MIKLFSLILKKINRCLTLSKQETCCQSEFGKPKTSDLFLDLANASTHTNYLIQIVKEQRPVNSAGRRSGIITAFNFAAQAFCLNCLLLQTRIRLPFRGARYYSNFPESARFFSHFSLIFFRACIQRQIYCTYSWNLSLVWCNE